MVGVETPGICGISALKRSFGGWLGCSVMRYSPMATELLEHSILKAVELGISPPLALPYEQSSCYERPFQPQLYARATSRATCNKLLHIQMVCMAAYGMVSISEMATKHSTRLVMCFGPSYCSN
jgi:hypothetical protein